MDSEHRGTAGDFLFEHYVNFFEKPEHKNPLVPKEQARIRPFLFQDERLNEAYRMLMERLGMTTATGAVGFSPAEKRLWGMIESQHQGTTLTLDSSSQLAEGPEISHKRLVLEYLDWHTFHQIPRSYDSITLQSGTTKRLVGHGEYDGLVPRLMLCINGNPPGVLKELPIETITAELMLAIPSTSSTRPGY
ncbi:MAG: hypothetical protein AABY13_01485 [Nanoarchaeota archaeon]